MATSFQNVNNIAGISVANITYGSAWGDFNGDGYPDLWVNNHFDNPGILYLNQGDGTFTDVTADVFILEELGNARSNSSDHHGSQWVDFDNDGDLDLIQLVASASTEPNLLFINDGGVLRDAAPELGLAYPEARAESSIWVDYDNDGLLDLVHTSKLFEDAPPTVFRQTSNGSFVDVGETVAPALRSNGGKFGNLADISGDGNLDLLIGGTSLIYDLTTNPFTNITNTVGGGNGGSDSIAADFNGDLLSDVYLTQRSRKEELGQVDSTSINGFLQTRNGEEGAEFTTTGDVTFALTFVSSVEDIFVGASGFNPVDTRGGFIEFTLSPDNPDVQGIADRTEPGVYIGYDASSQNWEILNFSPNNSQLAFEIEIDSDRAITDLNAINFNPDPVYPPDRLLINTDQGLVDRTNQAGLGDLRNPGNSVTAGDFDNDMDVDLYVVATGSALNSDNVYLDNQGDGTFVSVANAGGALGSSLGLGDSVTTADYDLDGFLDLFVTNGFVEGTPLFSEDGPHELFRNQSNNNNWLQIDLEGVQSNRDGIGAQIFATAGGVTQLREQSGGVHKWSQDHQRIHFGLAENTQVDLLEIRWPSGVVQQLENIAANQLIEVVEETNVSSNIAPQAVADSAETQQNLAVNIGVLNNDSDADGDPLSLSINTAPSNGTAVIDDNGTPNNLLDDSFVYTPNTDFTGNDQFSYQIDDGNGGIDTATVSVTVNSTTEGINGTEGSDTLVGTADDDLINGLGGRDVLRGLGGNDTLNGGAGNDNLQGGFNDDVLNGDSGNDFFIGTFGNDILTGGAGSDRFRFTDPSDGVDEITDFTSGEDKIEIKGSNFSGSLANGVLPSSQFVLGTTAGDSDDRFIYDQSEGNFFFDADGVGGNNPVLLATLSDGANLSASDIRIFGAATAPSNTPPQAVADSAVTQQNQTVEIDVLSNDSDADGDPLSLSIDTAPNNGNAVVDDNGTVNNLLDDFISYIPNTDFTGNDQFTYAIDDGKGGVDTATVSVTVNSASTTAGINGTQGRDTLNGTANDDLINGLGERDVLKGLGGNDTLNGGAGNDNLRGGFNNDVLNGDSGNDFFIGGFGNDILTGGEGSDRFRFFRTDEEVDEITDFTGSEDRIEIKGNNFGGGLSNGVLPSSQFVLGTTAGDSDDRFIYDQSEGALFFDVDGNGGNNPVLLATLSNQANLSASDIRII